MEGLTRSQLAKKCEVNIETLRYYEKRRLLAPPPRSVSGYRIYSEEDALKIGVIKNA
ncbi:MAG: MerR family DNA-binding transcriptional regulator, partial [Nitrospinae bacterium]|nr:MerR family DNA-binding transcriptional regulator [Nitrospinota bacterium]